MFNESLQFLLKAVIDLFVLAALVRFFLQYFRAPFRNPLSEFVVALTDFAVKPLRRIIPGWQGLDLASLVLAIRPGNLVGINFTGFKWRANMDGRPAYRSGSRPAGDH